MSMRGLSPGASDRSPGACVYDADMKQSTKKSAVRKNAELRIKRIKTSQWLAFTVFAFLLFWALGAVDAPGGIVFCVFYLVFLLGLTVRKQQIACYGYSDSGEVYDTEDLMWLRPPPSQRKRNST